MPDSDAELLESLARAVTLVREDREHGASWLARQVAQALADASQTQHGSATSERMATLHAAAQAFARARPSMAAVANTAARIWQAGSSTQGQSPEEQRVALHAEAARLVAGWQHAADAITGHARGILGPVTYTHSRSGTVEQVLQLAAQRDDTRLVERIIADESRPGGEGVAAARAFAAAGVPVTLVADGACGLFLPEASAVVLGADSVRADGSVVNKVGSFPLAVTARALDVPVYVLCETLKIAAPTFPLTLEEMAPDELLPEPVPGITARNIYFDRTPAEYVSGVVTEEGVLDVEAITARAQAAGEALAALEGGEQ